MNGREGDVFEYGIDRGSVYIINVLVRYCGFSEFVLI